MKLSQLMEKLLTLREKHGDIEIDGSMHATVTIDLLETDGKPAKPRPQLEPAGEVIRTHGVFLKVDGMPE